MMGLIEHERSDSYLTQSPDKSLTSQNSLFLLIFKLLFFSLSRIDTVQTLISGYSEKSGSFYVPGYPSRGRNR